MRGRSGRGSNRLRRSSVRGLVRRSMNDSDASRSYMLMRMELMEPW